MQLREFGKEMPVGLILSLLYIINTIYLFLAGRFRSRDLLLFARLSVKSTQLWIRPKKNKVYVYIYATSLSFLTNIDTCLNSKSK